MRADACRDNGPSDALFRLIIFNEFRTMLLDFYELRSHRVFIHGTIKVNAYFYFVLLQALCMFIERSCSTAEHSRQLL
jgi:hypothetical protein